jgi:hypothetical protein
MSNQDSRRTDSDKSGVSSEAISDIAREAAAKAKEAVTDTAETARDFLKDAADRQIGSGVKVAEAFVKSVRRAADDLQVEAPLLAGLVDVFADRVEHYADDMRDRTVDHLIWSSSNFTRKNPAVVFGLAALAGFLTVRVVRNAMSDGRNPQATRQAG